MNHQHRSPPAQNIQNTRHTANMGEEEPVWGNQDTQHAIRQLKVSPPAIRARLEASLGISLPRAEIQLGEGQHDTPAYAAGMNIFLNPGIFEQSAAEQEEILLHELSHLAQAMMPASLHNTADPEADAQRVTRDVRRGRKTAPGTAISGGAPRRYTQTTTESLGTFSNIVATSGWLVKGCADIEGVMALQTFLASLNLYTLKIDGDFGSYTEAAVRQFQSNNQLTSDGQVGPMTAAVIDAQNTGVTVGSGESQEEGSATETTTEESSGTDASATSLGSFAERVSSHGWLVKGCADIEGVMALQTFLTSLNLYTLKIDGDFGSYTEAAVRQFQSNNQLTSDGQVGPMTAAVIDAQNTGVTIGSGESQEESQQTSSEVTTTPTTGSGPSWLSAEAQAVRTLVLQVLALANDHSRYSDIYDNNGSNGTFLRDYMATHGKTSDRDYFLPNGSSTSAPTQAADADEIISNSNQVSAFPDINLNEGSESGLGVEALLDFIDSGGFDQLTADEQAAFTRAVSQLGSFYGGYAGQSGISNRYTWTPSGYEDADMYGGWIIQDESHVGKWDCSSFASYVQGDGYMDTSTMMRQSSLQSVTWANYTNDAAGLKEVAPVGSILVKSGHCMVVIGHSGTSLLVMESQGSGHFVSAKLYAASTLADTDYQVLPPS